VKTSIRGASLFAIAPAVPGFLAATARAAAPLQDGRVLVVVQLDGGNDGINTVVPYKDEGYAKNRQALRLSNDKLHKVNDAVGLHPSLKGAAKLLERGELAIVQGIGYPNPTRSHFRSMAIWQTARLDPEEHNGPGWLGRVFDERLEAQDAAGTTFVGAGQPPAALIGRRSIPASLERLGDLALKGGPGARGVIGDAPEGDDVGAFVRRTALDAYTAADSVAGMIRAGGREDGESGTDPGGRLSLIARLIKSGARARVYYTLHYGYDTHVGQLRSHASLLLELSEALRRFQDNLDASGMADRVLVLCVSEFGRRVHARVNTGRVFGISIATQLE
jgi:uncharacterized protein (DUF1501 family)